MKETEVFYNAEKNMKQIFPMGAFLTAGDAENNNTMTIGWGSIGFCWGKPIFTVMVTPSRYTHDFLEKYPEFCVTFPYEDQKKALVYLGSHSGRDGDKIKEANVTLEQGHKISTPHVKCAGMTYECKIIHANELDPNRMLPEIEKFRYPDHDDYHTFYFGEIVSTYITE